MDAAEAGAAATAPAAVLAEAPLDGRCAAHPARPAHDLCPTCGRPRCSADARDLGARCPVCTTVEGTVRPLAYVLVATGVVGTWVAVAGAAVGQEYVGARWFSVIFPALIGLVISALALAAAGAVRPSTRRLVGLVAAGYAAVSALLDFRFTDEPYGPYGRWLPPLVAAAVTALVAAELLARRPTQVRAGSADGVRTGTSSRR